MEVVFKPNSDVVDVIRFNESVEVKRFVSCSSDTFLTVLCDVCIARSGMVPWTKEPTFLMDSCGCCNEQGYFKAVEIDGQALLRSIKNRNIQLLGG